MTARSMMTMRADVERDSGGVDDDWNQPPAAAWAAHITSQPCLFYSKAKREVEGGGRNEKIAVVEDLRMSVPLGVDVTERDRVVNVKDRKGTTIFAGPFYIETVQRRRTHLELLLSRTGQ